MDALQTIALSAGLAWASGLRLYLVVFLAGVLGYFGYLHLPSLWPFCNTRWSSAWPA